MNKDPYNVIVAGVGGQGNVLGSQLIGTVLVNQGYKVTIGETYGASQRGGSVMSHLRISQKRQYGPLIPPGLADLVIGLEPSEAVRVLSRYGNKGTVVVVNVRPIYSIDVTGGSMSYPRIEDLLEKIRSLTDKAYFIDATESALRLGNPILANLIMIGAVSAAGMLPIRENGLEEAISQVLSSEKAPINLEAFATGKELVMSQVA